MCTDQDRFMGPEDDFRCSTGDRIEHGDLKIIAAAGMCCSTGVVVVAVAVVEI